MVAFVEISRGKCNFIGKYAFNSHFTSSVDRCTARTRVSISKEGPAGPRGASPEINSSVDGLRCKITTNGWLPAASNSPVIPLLSYLFERSVGTSSIRTIGHEQPSRCCRRSKTLVGDYVAVNTPRWGRRNTPHGI